VTKSVPRTEIFQQTRLLSIGIIPRRPCGGFAMARLSRFALPWRSCAESLPVELEGTPRVKSRIFTEQ